MKYAERYRHEKIDEWSRCYLNYEHLKVLNNLMRESLRQTTQIKDILEYGMSNEALTEEGTTINIKY